MERVLALVLVFAVISSSYGLTETFEGTSGKVTVDNGQIGIGGITGGSFGPGSFSITGPDGVSHGLPANAVQHGGPIIINPPKSGVQQDNLPPQTGEVKPSNSGGGNFWNAGHNNQVYPKSAQANAGHREFAITTNGGRDGQLGGNFQGSKGVGFQGGKRGGSQGGQGATFNPSQRGRGDQGGGFQGGQGGGFQGGQGATFNPSQGGRGGQGGGFQGGQGGGFQGGQGATFNPSQGGRGGQGGGFQGGQGGGFQGGQGATFNPSQGGRGGEGGGFQGGLGGGFQGGQGATFNPSQGGRGGQGGGFQGGQGGGFQGGQGATFNPSQGGRGGQGGGFQGGQEGGFQVGQGATFNPSQEGTEGQGGGFQAGQGAAILPGHDGFQAGQGGSFRPDQVGSIQIGSITGGTFEKYPNLLKNSRNPNGNIPNTGFNIGHSNAGKSQQLIHGYNGNTHEEDSDESTYSAESAEEPEAWVWGVS